MEGVEDSKKRKEPSVAEVAEVVPEEDITSGVEEAGTSADAVAAKRPRLEDEGSNPPSAQLKVRTQVAALLPFVGQSPFFFFFLPERFNLTFALFWYQFAGEDSNGAEYASEEALWRSLKRAKTPEGGQGDDTTAEGKPWYQGSGTAYHRRYFFFVCQRGRCRGVLGQGGAHSGRRVGRVRLLVHHRHQDLARLPIQLHPRHWLYFQIFDFNLFFDLFFDFLLLYRHNFST